MLQTIDGARQVMKLIGKKIPADDKSQPDG